MRYNDQESAMVVLERLHAAKPMPPTYINPHNKRPHQDRTFAARLQAWEAAVRREEARFAAEKTGTLDEHLAGLKASADRDRAVRLKAERAVKIGKRLAERLSYKKTKKARRKR